MSDSAETEQPIYFSAQEMKENPIIEFFAYNHLPQWGQTLSRPFAKHVRFVLDTVPPSAERTAGLRKLLEAKDCIVRAGKPRA